ncbi:MAG TPA: ABC transporter ATP-binding protein [Bacillales bacterium]|nr:ABC transporter ATP-binding protein [Bacillales bacterium]
MTDNARIKREPSMFYLIIRLICYEPAGFAAASLCWFLFHCWALIPGILAKLFFDSLDGNTPARLTLGTIVVLVLAAGLLRSGIILGSSFVNRPWSLRIKGLLQRNLLDRILQRPGAKALPGSVGEALSTLRDDVSAIKMMVDWVFDAAAGIALAVIGIVILFSVDARVTLLVFIPIGIVISLAFTLRTRLKRVREQSRTATANVTGIIGEIFGSVQTIQAAGAEKWVIGKLKDLGDVRQQKMLRDRFQSEVVDGIFRSTASIGAGITLLVAASEMRKGTFTVGDFALFSTYLMQVAEYTGFFGYLTATFQQSGIAFKRAMVLLQGAPPSKLVEHHSLSVSGSLSTVKGGEGRSDSLKEIKVTGLTFRYSDSGRGIENISFTADRGSVTVVTGGMGAGKTTLLRAMLGLLKPESGAVYWNDRLVEEPSRFFQPPRMAYTPQVPTLISGTIKENILLGLRDESVLNDAVKQAVLDEDLSGFPKGWDTLIGARGVRLSGGQMQRTAAARMFARQPELLVFDDLSSALDVKTEQKLWDQIYAQKVTCIAVSHRRSILQKADRILVLRNGRLTSIGKWRDLLKTNDEIRRIWAGADQKR